MKPILMLLDNCFTHDSRVLKEARSLVNNGSDVTIICFWQKGLKRIENIDNINVVRTSKYTKRSDGFLNHFMMLPIHMLRFLFTAIKYARNRPIIHCHDLQNLSYGVILKFFWLGKRTIIYDAHELETETQATQSSPLFKQIKKLIERCCISFAKEVITVSNGIAEDYVQRYGIKKPHLILNCPPYWNSDKQYDRFRERFNIPKETIIFLYQGGLSKGRGIEVILEAFKQKQSTDKVVVFMGYGTLEKEIRKAAYSYNTIFYHEAVSPNILMEYTNSADTGISLIETNCLSYQLCLPNKLFESAMAGIPIIVASDTIEQEKLISQYMIGISSEQTVASFNKIVDSITYEQISNWKKNLPAFTKVYCWEEQEKVLLSIYDSL